MQASRPFRQQLSQGSSLKGLDRTWHTALLLSLSLGILTGIFPGPVLLSAQGGYSAVPGEPFGGQIISGTHGSFFADLQEQEHFGFALCSMGDMDGDGIRDLLVGAPGRDGRSGAAYLLWINNDGWVYRWERFAEGENGLSGLQPNDRFGTAVAELGDLDGNGHLDFAVSAPAADSGRGVVHLFYRDSTGFADHVAIHYRDVLTLLGLEDSTAYPAFGTGMTPFYPRSSGSGHGLMISAAGSQGLFYLPFKSNGQVGKPIAIPGPTALDTTPWQAFGRSLDGREDADKDGLPDVLVGAPLADSGRGAVYWLASASGYPSADWRKLALPVAVLDDLGAEARLGTAVAWIGDKNWDGRSEWVLGAPGIPEFDDGAYVYGSFGSGQVVDSAAVYRPDHHRLDDFGIHHHGFGTALANLRDHNSDHYGEVAVGLPRRDEGGTNLGGLAIVRLFRSGIGTPWDYHYACGLDRRMERQALSLFPAGYGHFSVPDSAQCDTLSVEVLYRVKPSGTTPKLRRNGYSDQLMEWFEAVPKPGEWTGGADTVNPWAVARIRFAAVDSFSILDASGATSAWLYRNRKGPGVSVQGTKGLFTRYSLRRGQTDRRFLTTILFPNPRDVFFQVQINGLASGQRVRLKTTVREEWSETLNVWGNGDSTQLVDFLFEGIPGGVHGVVLEVHSPEADGGNISFGWAAGYDCTIDCMAPSQLFFESTGATTGRLFWQRIPADNKDYTILLVSRKRPRRRALRHQADQFHGLPYGGDRQPDSGGALPLPRAQRVRRGWMDRLVGVCGVHRAACPIGRTG